MVSTDTRNAVIGSGADADPGVIACAGADLSFEVVFLFLPLVVVLVRMLVQVLMFALVLVLVDA
jgi:hypothetical protein